MKVYKEDWGLEIEGNITEIINWLHANWTSVPENADAILDIILKPKDAIQDIADDKIARPSQSTPDQIADEMR